MLKYFANLFSLRRGALLCALAVLAPMLFSCAPRQIEVKSGPQATSDVSLRVTNNLSQAVNIYVVTGGNDRFVKQVAANSAEVLPVQGISAGTIVQLRARTTDGTREYTKDDVTLTSVYEWRLP